MEKLQKTERFKDLDDAVEQYNQLYEAYEKAVSESEYWENLYNYVAKEKVVLNERYAALANMVSNAAELVNLLNH